MKRFAIALGLVAASWMGVAQAASDDEAYERLFKAQLAIAETGDSKGMFYLAEMYDNGLGTRVDHSKAIEWYSKAAAKGNPLAKRRLDEAAKSQQVAKMHVDSEREAERARRKAAEEAARAAKAAEQAKRQSNEQSIKAAKAAEAARKKAEQEAMVAAARLAQAETARKEFARKEAARRAAFKRAWEIEVKRAKAAANVIE